MTSERTIPFLAYWVSCFLSFANNNTCTDTDVLIRSFIEHLSTHARKKDWQIRQAHDAVELYLFHYLKHRPPEEHPQWMSSHADSFSSPADLINKAREATRLKHYSRRTEKTYLHWIRRFQKYMSTTSPQDNAIDQWDSADVQNFLSRLAVKDRVSSSYQNQAFNALLFLFRNVLRKDLDGLRNTVRARRGPKLPVVLTQTEAKTIFDNLAGKNRLFLQLIYGAGLRISEFVNLRVKDIDFQESLIFVRSGKGDKDRATVMPRHLEPALSQHLKEVKAIHLNDLRIGYGEAPLPFALKRKYPGAQKEWGWQYVFPSAKLSIDNSDGVIRRFHMSEKTLQKAMRTALKKAGIVKHAGVHTLRHSFATHLIMNGVNIREVQELLGHKHVETTMIYTHVMRNLSNAPRSPLDALYESKKC